MFTSSAKTHVFADGQGYPCKFFVEAAAVRERPALIRKIMRNGGSIVNTVPDADILLAESNTKEALELFEAWRGDKTLLSTRWVACCLEENTFFGSDRRWAGFELTSESLLQGIRNNASEAEEEDEAIEKPRRSRRTVSSSQSKQTVSKPGSSRLTSSPPSQNNPRQLRSTKAKRTSDQSHPPVFASPHLSPPQSRPMETPQSSQNTAWSTNPSFQASSSPIDLQQLYTSMFSGPPQSQQQPISPDLYASGQIPNLAQLAPLLHPLLQQLFAQQAATNLQPLNSQPTGLSDQSKLGGTGQQVNGVDALPSSIQESSSRSTPEDVDPDLASDDASATSEEAEVELSISQRCRTRKRMMSGSPSDPEIQTAVRSNPPRPKETASKKKSGIFANGKGRSGTFYVMIDLKNRKDLLKIIRKHDGNIVSQMDDADYIILNTRSTQFQKALDILPIRKLAFSSEWIEECERANKLVDMTPYVIDDSSGVGRGAARRKTVAKARRPTSKGSTSKANSSPLLGKKMEDTTPKRTLRKVAPKVQPQEALTNPLSRSPSPMPPADIESVKNGFTENDRVWFLTYARFKLKRDPHITSDALIQAIARKAPHHSVQSWVNAWRTMWLDEMRALKQDFNVPVEQRIIALPSSSDPSTSGEKQNGLKPELSTPPLQSQVSPGRPPNSTSTWNSSQAESNQGTPLKRKEEPNEEHVDNVALNQQNKRFKTS